MTKRNKRFFRMLKMDLIRLAVYAVMLFVAIWLLCFVLTLPEMIGTLVFELVK